MTTDNSTYKQLFHSLIQHKESEVVEFKKAENNFDFDDSGKYFSALSNEANLRSISSVGPTYRTAKDSSCKRSDYMGMEG